MKKNIKKIIIKSVSLLPLTGMLWLISNNKAFAGWFQDAKKFVSPSGSVPISISDAADPFKDILNILYTVAVVTLVITGTVLAVKYMMASPNDKAKVKQQLIWYVIAIIIVFGGIGITQLVLTFFNSNL